MVCRTIGLGRLVASRRRIARRPRERLSAWSGCTPLVDGRRTVVVGVAAAVTCGLVVFAAGSAEPQVPTSYAATSPWLRAADLTAGLGLVLTGLIARCEPRTRGLGLLVVLAGCAGSPLIGTAGRRALHWCAAWE